MIAEAVVILLIILILANILLSIINYISPPYKNNISEYLQSAKMLPDGQLSSLGSIPSGTDVNYVGFKLDSDKEGNYIVKSRNEDYEKKEGIQSSYKSKYIPYKVSKDEDMEMLNNSFKPTNKLDKSAVDAVSKALNIKSVTQDVEERSRTISKYGDNPKSQHLAMFDTEFEGISAQNRTPGRIGPIARSSEMSMKSERDGYS